MIYLCKNSIMSKTLLIIAAHTKKTA